jgi:hypothetical protein
MGRWSLVTYLKYMCWLHFQYLCPYSQDKRYDIIPPSEQHEHKMRFVEHLVGKEILFSLFKQGK